MAGFMDAQLPSEVCYDAPEKECDVQTAKMDIRYRAAEALRILRLGMKYKRDAELMAAVRTMLREERDELAILADKLPVAK